MPNEPASSAIDRLLGHLDRAWDELLVVQGASPDRGDEVAVLHDEFSSLKADVEHFRTGIADAGKEA